MSTGGRIKGGGWLLSVERLDFANLSCARGRLNFANSSTCALELAELRVVSGQAGTGGLISLKLAKLRVVGGCTRAGRLNFANLSTCALKLAELRVVGAQASMGRMGKLSFARAGRLDFNLSTCMLKLAELRMVGGQANMGTRFCWKPINPPQERTGRG